MIPVPRDTKSLSTAAVTHTPVSRNGPGWECLTLHSLFCKRTSEAFRTMMVLGILLNSVAMLDERWQRATERLSTPFAFVRCVLPGTHAAYSCLCPIILYA